MERDAVMGISRVPGESFNISTNENRAPWTLSRESARISHEREKCANALVLSGKCWRRACGAGGALLATPGCMVKDIWLALTNPRELQATPLQTSRQVGPGSPSRPFWAGSSEICPYRGLRVVRAYFKFLPQVTESQVLVKAS